MKLRIWSEFLKPEEVMQPFVVKLLKDYKVQLHFKLEYMNLHSEFFDMLHLYNDEKIPISIWLTLSDKLGYWINERNAGMFKEYVMKVVDRIEEENCEVSGISIDMEPPLKQVQAIANPRRFFQPYLAYVRMATVNVNERRYFEAVRHLLAVQKFLHDKGIESFATFLRLIYYDIRFDTNVLQNALETPVFPIPWDKYNIMYYATMTRQELKHRIPEEIDYKIYHELSFLRRKIGQNLCTSVGLTNSGKLGNELYYNSNENFIKDIGIIKACGIDDITLFSLDGILNPQQLERYLKLIVDAEPIYPDMQESIIAAEARFKRFIKLIKGYYSLYKI